MSRMRNSNIDNRIIFTNSVKFFNYIKLLENKEIDQNELQECIKKYNNVVKEMKIKWVALKD